MTVADLRKRVDGVLQKGRELLEVSASLREKKIKLEEKLMSWLLELQKAWEEVSDLQKKVASAQSEISSLREHIDRGYSGSWRSSMKSACCEVTWKVVTRMWKSGGLKFFISRIIIMIFGAFIGRRLRRCDTALSGYSFQSVQVESAGG